ncbi:MAG TPA: PhpK family radical SAM P-methyltransferase [Blastocatellia bacterium]|nr:PhpK family radical SAM P-methyltransferase [Blastocatellia bacterium]
MTHNSLDCIVIGYNELPFEQYESLVSRYGEDSEAYRDLQYSFVNLAGEKLSYVKLLNHVIKQSHAQAPGRPNASAIQFESGDIPNLAAVYLVNFLRKRGHRARHVNLFQREKERLLELLASDPHCVAITTTFYVLNFPVTDIVRFIKHHRPAVKVVVGGPLIANHARNNAGAAFESAILDIGADIYVIEGQGEQTLSTIVDCLKRGGDLASVPNIAYYDHGQLRRTVALAENNSLDENYIDWLGFADEQLGPTIQTRAARSCAFQCSFCNYPTRAGKLTLTNLDVLERELDSLRELGDIQNLVFIDDTFNVPLARFKDICRLIARKRYGFNWFSYFRCSNSDLEAIDLMAESGCKGVFLGIESGSAAILKNMNKAATPEKYLEGMRLLHERGILTFASFIIGFPGEVESTVQETRDFIRQSHPSYYRAQLWYCEPGTPIEKQGQKYGIEGEGFRWRHTTMDSLEAMDHIDRLFLTIDESIWLPQWSFDFWIIPYLLGRQISLNQFKDFMTLANKLLALEIAFVPAAEKRAVQAAYLQELVGKVREWNLTPASLDSTRRGR